MSKENQDKLLLLMDEAMNEGVQSMAATINKAKDDAYMEGYRAALKDLPIAPTTDEEGDGIPVHNITNPIVRDYFEHLPEGGYAQNDVSRMWYYTKYVSESSKKNMADRGNPYIVYCDGGDSLLLYCEGEKPQTILPYHNIYECYILMPNKTYNWKVMNGDKIVKEGRFKTIGDVRLINLPTWPNMRDIGGHGLKHGLVYSGANPDSVVVGSDDYNVIKYLGIDTQINFRTPKASSASENPWRSDIFSYGYNIDIADYSSLFTKTAGFKKAFETFVVELKKGRKVAFNCYAGADRTGTFRYVVQGVCLVPKKIAQGFYELTSIMYWLNTKMWDKEGEDDFRKFDADLEKKFGKDFYTQCYRLLTEVVKVSPTTIRELQDILMENPSLVPQI